MKKIIAIICLALVLATVLVGCGNRIEDKAAKLEVGMTYEKAVDILGKEGEDVGGEKEILFSWDCGEGKSLLVWLTIPYEDHDHSDPNHTHNYEYPNQFVISKFEITEAPVAE